MANRDVYPEKSVNRGMEAHHHGEDEHHVLSPMFYLLIFGGLIVGTIFTVLAALYDLDSIFVGANTAVALIIAFAKTSLVVLFFMHVWYSGKLVWLSVGGGLIWLVILFLFVMSDYLTRGIVPGTYR